MNNEQSEALRLAEAWQKRAEYLQIWIDDGVGAEFSYRHEGLICEQKIQFGTAAELRRLHLVNQELLKILAYVEASDLGSMLCARARAAIQKAKGEK